jgi:hypothetical protein
MKYNQLSNPVKPRMLINKILPLLTLSIALMFISTLKASEASSLQQPTVKGKVADMFTGDAIVGATIMVKGTSTGVKSQKDGTYSIALPASAKVLVYSAAGYQTLEIDIDGRTDIDVSMSEGNSPEESDLWD